MRYMYIYVPLFKTKHDIIISLFLHIQLVYIYINIKTKTDVLNTNYNIIPTIMTLSLNDSNINTRIIHVHLKMLCKSRLSIA